MVEEDDSLPRYLEKDKGPPLWLKISYVLLPIWGIIAFYLYWNGSHGFLDRGHWEELQRASNTRLESTKNK